MIIHQSSYQSNPRLLVRRSRRDGYTLIEALVVLVILGVIAAMLVPATRRSREAARRSQCKNYLKQIGLALHNYHDTYGVFPPAYTVDANGGSLHSWRTLLLPYVDQEPLYRKIDLSKAWDDPANSEAQAAIMTCYACPSTTGERSQTTYLAVVTADSCLRPSQSRKLAEITDGSTNTILVIEVRQDQAVHWMSPRDADEQILQNFGPDAKESHTGGRHVLLGDGAARFLSQNTPPETLQALYSATGGETVGEY
ncbi:MAG: DUF1559 domain-containing protein [Planctomycetaceae bacterium]|nr:DUF1559 domain-containing protein [Planctomycetaceae bacterium]